MSLKENKLKDIIFRTSELESIAKIIGDTNDGLTGTEIGQMLKLASIVDTEPSITKWRRLYSALMNEQSKTKKNVRILNFIHYSLSPQRFVNRYSEYLNILSKLNIVLSFKGIKFKEDGKFHRIKESATLSEAQRRANILKQKLMSREVEPFILGFCDAELLKDNYFYAVLEACKGITDTIRRKSNLSGDGTTLVDSALGGKSPILKINSFSTETEKGEQRGFVNLAKGLYGVFRIPTVHEPRKEWDMSEQDALDLLVLASYVYRRLKDAK